MCLKIILKVTKNQGFTLSLEDTFFEKPQRGFKLTPPRRFRVNESSKLTTFSDVCPSGWGAACSSTQQMVMTETY